MIHILLSRGILGSELVHKYAKTYIKSNMKVLIVALSFFEQQFKDASEYNLFYGPGGEYYEKMVGSFIPYGIPEKHIDFLNYYKDDQNDALKKIQKADIIYFPGGAPDLMMKRIKALGIEEALLKKTFFIGSSAGAMIQFQTYHISKDYDYKKFSYEEGLNLIKGYGIEVHYRRKKVQKSAMRKVHRAYKIPMITLPDDGCIIDHDGHLKLIGTAKLYYDEKGVIS